MSVCSRRNLIRKGGLLGFALPIVAMLGRGVAFATAVVYKKADFAVEKKNPTLAAFKYTDDATKSKDRADKQGVAAKDQFCDNCNFYKNEGTVEGSAAKAGQCLMLQNQVVPAKAWCNLWAKKA